MKVSIIGLGYVGLSLSVLISQKYEVFGIDINSNVVELVNKKKSPIKDSDIIEYLEKKKLKLRATTNFNSSIEQSDLAIICTPTNYDDVSGSFDTSSVKSVIDRIININKDISIIIKSTVPIGFTEIIKDKYNKDNIYFSPEFLRESKALYDNLYPSRVIIGGYGNYAEQFSKILIDCAEKKESDIPIIYMTSNEAEAVKLFSNTYLAMRVAFFNELDSFCEVKNLDTKKIIEGVGCDTRIGNHYNNPSFGYGGYCLPKDTKQLLENFQNVPNEIIRAVVDSNQIRKDFIVNTILNKKPKTVGVYRLIMKDGSDNFRESAVIDIIKSLDKNGLKIIIFEPLLDEEKFNNYTVIRNLQSFLQSSDLIIANRSSNELIDFKEKVYSRDIFGEN